MAVYNGSPFLSETIESVLAQTYKNIEFLIINDASTDNSKQIITSYKDRRIRLINNLSNIGQTRSLNRGTKLAKGKYVARLDSDDMCLPHRIEKQVIFLEATPSVGICGSYAKAIGLSTKQMRVPVASDEIKAHLLFENPIIHPTVMMRKDVIANYEPLYDARFHYAQDYDLWSRISNITEIVNLPRVLVHYRVHEKQMSVYAEDKMQYEASLVRERTLKEKDIFFSQGELSTHNAIGSWNMRQTKQFVCQVHDWLTKLKQANDSKELYSKNVFDEILSMRWFSACTNAANNGVWALKMFYSSPLAKTKNVSFEQKIKFVTKCFFSLFANT
jgi:glycosyltransferase involved in cell wall biosynthesis